MTLEEIDRLRAKLEKDLLQLLQQFETETCTSVQLNITVTRSINSRFDQTAAIEAIVQL